MDEPRRWLDPRSDASAELRSLIAAGSPPPPLPPAVRAAGAKHVAGLAQAAAVAPAATLATKALALLCAVGTAALVGAAGLRATPRPAARTAAPAARIASAPPSSRVPVVSPVVTPVAVVPSLHEPPARPAPRVLGRRVALRLRDRNEAVTAPAEAAAARPSPSDEARIEAARAGLVTTPAESLALAQSTPADGPLAEEREWLT